MTAPYPADLVVCYGYFLEEIENEFEEEIRVQVGENSLMFEFFTRFYKFINRFINNKRFLKIPLKKNNNVF
jgi:hypothetical protein